MAAPLANKNAGFIRMYDHYWSPPRLNAKNYQDFTMTARGKYYHEKSQQRAIASGREVLIVNGEIGRCEGFSFYDQ